MRKQVQTFCFSVLSVKLKSIIVIFLFICLHKCNAYNISPKPNKIFRDPITNLNTRMPKVRSSYFGFSINLKHNR